MRAIYKDRTFQVSDGGVTSDPHKQNAGICQGCPLSPFLFVAVMTVLMVDASTSLKSSTQGAVSAGAAQARFLFDLLYADDTLIIGSQARGVEELARAVEASAALGKNTIALRQDT